MSIAGERIEPAYVLEGSSRSWNDWRRVANLIRHLTRRHLALRYRGSVLGFFWSLLNPLMMMAIYSIAFRYIMRIQLDRYTFFLLVGRLPWTFFATASVASTLCVITNGGLLGRVTNVGESFLVVKIAEGVEVKVQKQSVSALVPKGTMKSE